MWGNAVKNTIGVYVDNTSNPRLNFGDITGAELRAHLEENPLIFYAPLITPTEEEITDTTLLSQLEDFYNAKTLQEKTIISQENDELPFILNLDYFTNSIAGNIAGVNYNVDTLIADIKKALEEINGESVGGLK